MSDKITIVKFHKGDYSFIKNKTHVLPISFEKILEYPYYGLKYAYFVKKNNLWGLYDVFNETFLIPCEYKKISYNSQEGKRNIIKVKNSKKKIGYVTPQNEVVVPCLYDYILIGDGVYHVEKNGKYGLINNKLEVIIDFVYSKYHILFANEVVKFINEENKCGLIDFKGKLVLPFEYDEIEYGFVGDLKVSKNNKHGILGPDFEVVIPLQYTYLKPYWKGHYADQSGDVKLRHYKVSVSQKIKDENIFEINHFNEKII